MARDKPFMFRTTADFLARIDKWCERQVPKVSRAHAIHVAVDGFLKSEEKKERDRINTERTLEILYERGELKRPKRQKGKKR